METALIGVRTRADVVPQSWISGRLAASSAVVVILLLLSLALDADGSLGTDTGGKVATVSAMVERGDWNPTIGYWAESLDRDGVVHPFFRTRRTEAGWVNVTTLPMILITRPLVGAFGPRALFAVPILGSLLTCLGAGELARLFGSTSWRPGFWAAATCSPVLVYGLDFWEHSIGLALMVWAAVALFSIREAEGTIARVGGAVASGVLFGLAATMRQEALVYGAAGGVVGLSGAVGRTGRQRLAVSGAMLAGVVMPLWANELLERAVIGAAVRGERAIGVVAGVAWTGAIDRLEEGILITASPINLVHPLSMVTSFLVAVALVWFGMAVLSEADTSRPAILCGLAVLLMFLRLIAFGPTFVPGLLAAVPAVGLGVAAALHRRNLGVLTLSLVPIPVVWVTQYSGAAEAQWAGRYILASGLVLVAYAVGTLGRTHPGLLAGFLVANIALSMLGLAWLIQRTHDFGGANREVAALDVDAVVFADDFIAREAAPLGWDRQWLSAGSDEERALGSEVMRRAGVGRFAFVGPEDDPDPSFAGYVREPGVRSISYGTFSLEGRVYVRTGS